ncbi:MAG TPA: imelysin family protein, partial [Rhizomicrobium sp.]|nr:imelysin family protein [Rhizomicrobium sp.]
MHRTIIRRVFCAAASILISSPASAANPEKADAAAVVAHYADMAEAIYGDALTDAKHLRASVDTLISHPAPETLDAARLAWKQAR